MLYERDMGMTDNCFLLFKDDVSRYTLPERFTFPFCYQPHPLCMLAATALQQYLSTQTAWQHHAGKMFGVLLVKNLQNEIGYLAAFSGQLTGQNHWPNFVPPIFDALEENGFFLTGQAEISKLNQRIEKLEQNPEIVSLELRLNEEIAAAEIQIEQHRHEMIRARKVRKAKREHAQNTLAADGFEEVKVLLAKESVFKKNQLKALTAYWQLRIDTAQEKLALLTDEITDLKFKRKLQSKALQQRVFDRYQFLNKDGATKGLKELFADTVQGQAPAGAGDCAAPKLLQYAFTTGLTPLAMAEFWWGASPKSEIRQHGHFYGACRSKCQPILTHMLAGMAIDDNPLLDNPGLGKSIEVVYEDDTMVVINKPSGLLSVPGKHINDSVYSRMRQQYSSAVSPLIVHRLDMSTSGLMVIALTKDAHKKLQQQFIKRTVKKRYIALLDGVLTSNEGFVELPLRVDLDDRPRQLVCYDYGKTAQTQWQVVSRMAQQTKVYFHPITGRTHQLRVHAAHVEGLNMPIVGDDLYGQSGERLHLHAESLAINHPATGEAMSFQIDAAF